MKDNSSIFKHQTGKLNVPVSKASCSKPPLALYWTWCNIFPSGVQTFISIFWSPPANTFETKISSLLFFVYVWLTLVIKQLLGSMRKWRTGLGPPFVSLVFKIYPFQLSPYRRNLRTSPEWSLLPWRRWVGYVETSRDQYLGPLQLEPVEKFSLNKFSKYKNVSTFQWSTCSHRPNSLRLVSEK